MIYHGAVLPGRRLQRLPPNRSVAMFIFVGRIGWLYQVDIPEPLPPCRTSGMSTSGLWLPDVQSQMGFPAVCPVGCPDSNGRHSMPVLSHIVPWRIMNLVPVLGIMSPSPWPGFCFHAHTPTAWAIFSSALFECVSSSLGMAVWSLMG